MSTNTSLHMQAEPLDCDAWETSVGLGMSLEWGGNAHEVDVYLSRDVATQYAGKLEELAARLRSLAEGKSEDLEVAA